jgi:hypothetical protein
MIMEFRHLGRNKSENVGPVGLANRLTICGLPALTCVIQVSYSLPAR